MIRQIYWKLRQQISTYKLNYLYPIVLNKIAKEIGKKDRIEVVFFAMNIATWRYQGVYDLLSNDARFNCHIVFTVPNTFSKDQQMEDINQMREYFGSKGVEFVDHDINDEMGYDVKNLINPDILFYPQPYDKIFLPNHEYSLYSRKLLCYIPYSVFITGPSAWQYDLPFHNLAWKIFCPILEEKENASKISQNHGRNWVVSGYYMLDKYLKDDVEDVWKIKDRSIKRLIWAPHFTLSSVTWLKPRSNFLWMSQLMFYIAQQYKNRIQIAFKPHPRLKSELYRHPNWGKERTDNYYQQWNMMHNTQLETGDFIDLFMTSDAMIHDCASFAVEYLFVNKPVSFVSKDIDCLKLEHSKFGCDVLDQHYIVGNEEQVMTFVNQVVLDGKDIQKEQRTRFYETILKPNITGTTSKFIVDNIKKSLKIKK